MAKKTVEKTTVSGNTQATRKHTETTLLFWKFQANKGDLVESEKLIVNTSNIKDTAYFNTGLDYFNKRAVKNSLIKAIDKARKDKDKADKAENTALKSALETKISDLEALKSKVQSAIDGLGLSDDRKAAYDEDLFLQFMSFPMGWTISNAKGMSDVMKVLAKTEDNGIFTDALKKELKDALQVVADNFATPDNEVYFETKVFVNSTLTQAVYRYYQDKSTRTENGGFKFKFKKDTAIAEMFFNELSAKYQGKLYTTSE